MKARIQHLVRIAELHVTRNRSGTEPWQIALTCWHNSLEVAEVPVTWYV